MSSTSIQLFQTQLNFLIINPTMNLADVRQAAAQLDGHLAPVIFDYLADAKFLPGAQLLQPPATPAFQTSPSALFRLQPKLGVADLADEWMHPYLAWAGRLKRSRQLLRLMKARQLRTATNGEVPDDSILAGLQLFLSSPEPGSDFRQRLLDMALTHPIGSYLCAEALHTTLEREAIFNAIASDSQAVLAASHIPGFTGACLPLASSRQDLASGMVVARLGTDVQLAAWLRQTGMAAFNNSSAAGTMLVMNPQAPQPLRDLWLDTIQHSSDSAVACSTVHRARQTWQQSEWVELKAALKSVAIKDHGRCWCNWFSRIERESAATALAMPANALWSFELVHNLNLDDEPLRFRLADQLGGLTYHHPSALVLEALNLRKELSQQGGR
jgi:hypothetical protein